MSKWSHFLEELECRKQELGMRSREECWYRGHSNREWPLLPTVLRHGLTSERLKRVESDLFFEFRSQAHEPFGRRLTGWETFFRMRHHGVPTRLLDWTETVGIALFFALYEACGAAGGKACIWLLNPYKLNEDHWGRDLITPKMLGWDADEETYYEYEELLVEAEPFDWEKPAAIYPDRNDARIFAQRGGFTLHGSCLKPLESQINDPTVLARVDLPEDAIEGAQAFLGLAGIDDYSVYGDLDSLGRKLTKRHLP